jgi:hypothetical protein
MLQVLIILIHILIIGLTIGYAFLFKKSIYDYYYLAFTYLALLHWTFLNSECVVTYLFKKIDNPDYIAGEDVHSHEWEVFQSKENIYGMNFIKNVLIAVSIYLVCIRNKISSLYYVPFIFLSFSYLYGIYMFENHYKNKTFLLLQEMLKYLLLIGIVLLYIFRKPILNLRGPSRPFAF